MSGHPIYEKPHLPVQEPMSWNFWDISQGANESNHINNTTTNTGLKYQGALIFYEASSRVEFIGFKFIDICANIDQLTHHEFPFKAILIFFQHQNAVNCI